MPTGRPYGYWRTDKPKEAGFSHELISADFEMVKNQTTLDELNVLPYPGIDTLYKAFHRNVRRIPNHDFLGTRKGTEYEWMTVQEVADEAKLFASGC